MTGSKEAENIFMLCRLGAHYRYQSGDIAREELPEVMRDLLDKLHAQTNVVPFRSR